MFRSIKNGAMPRMTKMLSLSQALMHRTKLVDIVWDESISMETFLTGMIPILSSIMQVIPTEISPFLPA